MPETDQVETMMTCMEVWGGNQATEHSFGTLGLEIWVYSRPWQESHQGGDVYFVSSCATGRITRLLVADVSGHGSAVAEISTRLRELMRRHVNHLDQRTFVSQMNDEFSKLRHSGGFATAVAATFFSPQFQLSVTNAGHPSPLLYDEQQQSWIRVDALPFADEESETAPSDLPLGLYSESQYRVKQTDLRPGQMLLLYTDSLIESHAVDGQMLQTDGLLSLVNSIPVDKPAMFLPELLKSIGSISPQNLQDDDVTALLIRCTGSGVNVPLFNRALAPFRFLKGCAIALLKGRPLPLPEFTWANFGGSIFDFLSRSPRKKS